MSRRIIPTPLSEDEAKLVAACIAAWEAQEPARQRERIARGRAYARYQRARRQEADEAEQEPTS